MTVTLITGTSTGIGKATALHLARGGHHVFAGMRNPAAAASSLTTIADQEGLALEVIQLNVNDPEECNDAVQTVLDSAGKIDVLINNAGISGGGPLEEVPEELLRNIFETNYFGPMRLMSLVIPAMRQARQGAIVNVSSIMGILARAGGSAYSGSKFALEASTEALAQEVYRFNIRVVLIEPGVIKTPLHGKGSGVVVPDSPYSEFSRRGKRLFDKLLQEPTMPEVVAETIQHALETDQPKLRYLIGEDAVKWATGRQAMADEEWIAAGREMTLDDYANFKRDRFDMEI